MNDTLHFSIEITASAKHVWETMLNHGTYEEWTTAFDPSSTYEGTWEKGSEIRFVSTTSGGGMVAEIAEANPFTYISVKHLGELKDGVVTAFPSPAFENYTFTEQGTTTVLEVEMQMEFTPETLFMKEMFEGMWPNALLKLKEICER